MLAAHLPALCARRVVLASGSPRRKELLELLGLSSLQIVPSTFDEDLDKAQFPLPVDYVKETARLKGLEVMARPEVEADLVISSDTVVVLDGTILEKPADEADAARMLAALSGNWHEVITAVALLRPEQEEVVFAETTRVKFAELSPEVIGAYVASGEGADKAGSYGIQGLGGSLISGIEGDYYTVMGFPMHRFSVVVGEMLAAES